MCNPHHHTSLPTGSPQSYSPSSINLPLYSAALSSKVLCLKVFANEGPLHIWTSTKEVEGYVQCEKIALLDLSVRGYKIIDSMPLSELINISDAIQGIFEYI